MAKLPGIPAIPGSVSPEVRAVLAPMREILQNFAANSVAAGGGSTRTLVVSGSGSGSTTGSGTTPAPVDSVPPPAPTGFSASGALQNVILAWDRVDPAFASRVAYAEVYRGETDSLAAAMLIGTTAANVFSDPVGLGTTRYYWIRYVSPAPVVPVIKGPFNSQSGAKAETGINTLYVLGLLNNRITQTQLYTDLNTKIDLTGQIAGLSQSVNTVSAKTTTRPNILPNGGFENGFTNWTADAPAAFRTEDSVWGRTAVMGTFSGAGSLYSDKFPVQETATYVITGDSLLFADAGAVYFDLLFYDAAGRVTLDSTEHAVSATHDFSVTDSNRSTHAIEAIAPPGSVAARARFVWFNLVNPRACGCRLIKVERGNLPATPYSGEAQSVAVQVQSSANAGKVTGLEAQYTVKIDLNGYVTGFGLASTVNNGVPASAFAVRADRFYIGAPNSSGVGPELPFIVQTTPTTINGVPVPVGVYIANGFIANGTITNAKIGNAAIDDAKIANLSADKITAGFLDAARINVGSIDAKIANIVNAQISGNIFSSNWNGSTQGWYLERNGKLYAGDGYFRGEVQATSGTFTGNIYAQNGFFGGTLAAGIVTFDTIISRSATSLDFYSYGVANDETKAFSFYMDHAGICVAQCLCNFNASGDAAGSTFDLTLTIDGALPSTTHVSDLSTSNLSLFYYAPLAQGFHTVYATPSTNRATAAHLVSVQVLRSYR